MKTDDNIKKMYSLKLHEGFMTFGIWIMRVPGGWMYDCWDIENDCYKQGTFVPYNEEDKLIAMGPLPMKISVVLIHTNDSFLPMVVQKFQSMKNPESGMWNHSGIRVQMGHLDVIFEASWKEWEDVRGKKKNAGAYLNPFSNYYGICHRDKYSILEIQLPDAILDPYVLYHKILKYEGTPYDFGNLLLHQVVYYTFEKWIGRKAYRAASTMVCHELTMTVLNAYFKSIGLVYNDAMPSSENVMFKQPHMAQVHDIYEKPWEQSQIQ